VARVRIAMKIQRPGRLQNTMHLESTLIHPVYVVLNAPLPAVLARSNLRFVPPNDFVESI
jgi:hypothetical protein